MAIRKSELYSSLWASCDELRGGMDASQYKDYVLVLLFIKYISDKYAGQPYAPLVIPEGSSFTDMVALKGKAEIGDDINKKIIAPLVAANQQLSQSDFPDFNDQAKLGSGKEMVERLTNLIAIFEKPELNFSRNRADDDDILGDAYEYLMRHFASESGKSKGQFYTPAEVSRIKAQVLEIRQGGHLRRHHGVRPHLRIGVAAAEGGGPGAHAGDALRPGEGRGHQRPGADEHDPARQSDGHDLAGEHDCRPEVSRVDRPQDVRLRGRQSAVLRQALEHGPGPSEGPLRALRRASACRPTSRATTPTCCTSCARSRARGRGSCILPHGVLFRGNAEAEIRKNLIQRGLIKGIIGLPANLFYGTGIPACIVVFDKRDAAAARASSWWMPARAS